MKSDRKLFCEFLPFNFFPIDLLKRLHGKMNVKENQFIRYSHFPFLTYFHSFFLSFAPKE